jgi:hypothetical protein
VAKLLGLWFFADSHAFHSTPASGALRWKSDVAKTRGDIVCSTDPDFPYSIEIKNQEKGEWDLLSILLNEGPIINKWWYQCQEDAEAVGKYPLLLFTRNQVPFMAMIRWFDDRYLKNIDDLRSFKFGDYYITPLACLLDANPPIDKNHIINAYFPDPSDKKIFQRHYLNVIKRINVNQ